VRSDLTNDFAAPVLAAFDGKGNNGVGLVVMSVIMITVRW